MPTAAAELRGVLAEPALADVPVAVLANKIDVRGAAGEAEVLYQLGVFHRRSGKDEADS